MVQNSQLSPECDRLDDLQPLISIVAAKRGRDVETAILNALLRHKLAQHQVSDLRPVLFAAYREREPPKLPLIK
jgi:hypothetical protein